jgi:RHS repeat-associated protein
MTSITPRNNVVGDDPVEVCYQTKCRTCTGGPAFEEPQEVYLFLDGDNNPIAGTGGATGCFYFQAPGGTCKHSVQVVAYYETCTACGTARSKKERFYVRNVPASPPDESYKTCDTPPLNACGVNVAGDPVDVALGRVFSAAVDIRVPGPFPVQLDRFHDSSRTGSANDGPLGRGWFSSLFVSLDLSQQSSGRITYKDETGRRVIVTAEQPPEGTGIGTTSEFREEIDGIARISGSGSNPRILRFQDRTRLTFDNAGKLTARQDPYDNVQTLTYLLAAPSFLVSVRDPFLRGIDVVWDDANMDTIPDGTVDRVVTVPGGLVIDYSVGATGGRTFPTLNAVTFPHEMGGTTTHTFTYDPAGRLLTVTDALGNILESHGYYTAGASAGKVQFTEGSGGRPHYDFTYPTTTQTVITDALGRPTTFDHDGSTGVVTRRTGPACGCAADWVEFAFDAALNLTQETRPYPEGALAVPPEPTTLVTAHRYDILGRLVQLTEDKGGPKQRSVTYQYGNVTFPFYATQVAQLSLGACDPPAPRTITVTYSASFPAPLSLTLAGCTATGTPVSRRWDRTYDGLGRLLTLDGPEPGTDDTTDFEYWPYPAPGPMPTPAEQQRAGYFKERRSPGTDGSVAAAQLVHHVESYDIQGRPTLVYGVNGAQHELEWGWKEVRYARLMPAAAPNNTLLTHEYIYDHDGRLKRIVFPKGNDREFEYSPQQLLVRVIDGEDGVVAYSYDLMDRLESEKRYEALTPTQVRSQWDWRYDGSDRLWKEFEAGQDPASMSATFTEFLYDSQSRPKAIIAPGGVRRRTFQHDRLNRVVKVAQRIGATEDPADLVTQFGWDVHDNLVSVIDPRGLATTRTFDDLGDLRSIDSPDSGLTAATYTPGGRPFTVTDTAGRVQQMTYDDEGRITLVSYPNESPPRNVQYFYDEPTSAFGRGRLTSATEPYFYDPKQQGFARFHYERRGLLTKEEHSRDPAPPNGNFEEKHQYDDNGNETEFGFFRYTHDLADRPKTVDCFRLVGGAAQWAPLVTTVVYEPAGPPKDIAFANGRTDARTYDLHLRPRTWIIGGTSTLIDYEYEWLEGRLDRRTDRLAGTKGIDYVYDDFDRMDDADSDPGLWGASEFDVDKGGNTTRILLGSQDTTLTYGTTTNRLQSATGAVTRGPVVFDGVGNTLSDGGPNIYTYTHGNRTATVLNATGPSTLHYGPFGTLRAVAPAGGPTSGQHKYLFGATGLPTLEWGGSQLFTTYGYLNGAPIGQGRVTVTIPPDTAPQVLTECFSYHADPFGTVHAMTRDDGTVAWQADYTPYGGIHALVASSVPNNLRFLGHLDSSELGLTINGFRLYEPALGRYIQPDPLGIHPEETLADGTNLPNVYGFADANPVTNGDPLGLYTKACHSNLTLKAGGGLLPNCLRQIACGTFRADTDWIHGVGGAANWFKTLFSYNPTSSGPS